MSELYEKLLQYSKSDYYPFHMPGHKRNPQADFLPYQLDITEIEDFDNLHSPKGLILEAQRQASQVYGSDETYFLINGSTSGLLAAISTVTSMSGKILMARNCHMAAYHAAFLKELEVVYVYPDMEPEFGLQGGISPAVVEKQLEQHPDIQAVIITSPTYDGVVSDVKEIADKVHKYGIPLIVDEAHGAHFGFYPGVIPESAVIKGADMIIHSLHKTLPSMTQTALLHVNGQLIDKKRLQKYLKIYQTSSPSYVMMAGMQRCIQLLEDKAEELFTDYVQRLNMFYGKMKKLKNLQIFMFHNKMKEFGIYDVDYSKLLISTKDTDITGNQLYHMLLHRYHLQMEMAAADYVLAMTSIMDTTQGFERLERALFEIDQEVNKSEQYILEKPAQIVYPCACIKISEAENAKSCRIALQDSADHISAEYVYLYPPGIPILAPGEKITEAILQQIEYYKKTGLMVKGTEDKLTDYIYVTDE